MCGLQPQSRTSRSRSRSRLLWQSLGLVSKFEAGLGLGDYGHDYITGENSEQGAGWPGWKRVTGCGLCSGWHKTNAQLATAVSHEYSSILWICQLLEVLPLLSVLFWAVLTIVIFSEMHFKTTLYVAYLTFTMQQQQCSFTQTSRNAVYFRLFLNMPVLSCNLTIG